MNNDFVPLVAILRGITPAEVEPIASALFDAGFRYLEIPLNSPDALHSIQILVDLFGTLAYCGAGTVTTLPQADAVISTGAKLVVTPNTDPAIIRLAKSAGAICMPGAMTPTEAFAALNAGANAVKLFPAGPLGTQYISQLRAVLPAKAPLLAVGGVGADNMQSYLQAGCHGIGFGSELYKPGKPAVAVKDKALELMTIYRTFNSNCQHD